MIATAIREIAAVYMKSAEAAQNFKETRDRSELEMHSKLFREASERFRALIEIDYSMHDCPLREISYAIVQHNFEEAKALYEELTKQTTTTQEENTMTTHNEFFEAKYAEECGPDHIVNAIYIEEMIEDFHEFGWDSVDYRFNYLLMNADAESIRAFVNGLDIGYDVEMFTNEISKNAKYVQDHARCGEECIVPEAKRIALANADENSIEFQLMF